MSDDHKGNPAERLVARAGKLHEARLLNDQILEVYEQGVTLLAETVRGLEQIRDLSAYLDKMHQEALVAISHARTEFGAGIGHQREAGGLLDQAESDLLDDAVIFQQQLATLAQSMPQFVADVLRNAAPETRKKALELCSAETLKEWRDLMEDME